MKISINIASEFSLLLLVTIVYDLFNKRNLDVLVDFEDGFTDVEFMLFGEFLNKSVMDNNIYAAKIMSKSKPKNGNLKNNDFLLLEEFHQVDIDDFDDNINLISNQMFDNMIKLEQESKYIVSCFKKSITKEEIKQFHFALNEAVIIIAKMTNHDRINFIESNTITSSDVSAHLMNLNYITSSPISMDNYKKAKSQINLQKKVDYNKIILK